MGKNKKCDKNFKEKKGARGADKNDIDTLKKKKTGTFCETCGKRLRSRYRLKLHMAVHTGEKNYICGICKKGYQQKWNLVTHVARVHTKEKPFKCNDCGKAFGYSSHFKRHVKTHFLEKIEAPDVVKKRILNPHKCQFCEKSFETNYRLDLHVRVHTGNRPFACDKCGKSFTNKRHCVVHMEKKHSGPELICYECGEAFPDQPSLFLHLTTEHKQREEDIIRVYGESAGKKELVPCEVCGKSISRESVKKHLNIHFRKRVYKCRYCSKEFLESGQRMVHERKHTGEKPYRCDICGRRHTQYGNLLTHRRRYHNIIGKTPLLWKRKEPHHALNSKVLEVSLVKDPLVTDTLEEKNYLKEKETVTEEPGATGKPKYTGNETIEDFLQIASQWVNKKFQESKQSQTESNAVVEPEAETDTRSSDDVCEHPESLDEVENKIVTDKEELAKEKSKASVLKEVKKKLNRVVYEKIVDSMSTNKKALQIVHKIREMKAVDPLREFIKQMKTIPDNEVIKTKDGKIFWHCWICDSKLRTRHLLTRHLIIHEPEENRPFKCEICYKTFTQSNNFKEHTMSHYNENQFYCDKCGNGFRHKSHFNSHMRRHEPATEGITDLRTKKYECSFCGKKVSTNYQKMEHERTHTKERPYLCKICGQQFGASSTLTRHQSTHSSASHQCNVCLKFFRQKSSLKRHYGTHSQYPYSRVSCECGKTFSQSPSLKKHKMICKNRVEPVVKPFCCLVCPKKFLTKSDLKRHVATHDSSKKFKCSVCLTSLKTDETYKRHMKRHQNEQTEIENDTQLK